MTNQSGNSDFNMNMRRLRQNHFVRELVREHRLSVEQFIQPLFVVEGLTQKESIPGMMGTYRDSPEDLLKTVESDLEAGVRKFLLFGVPLERKEKNFQADFTSKQVSELKKRFGKEVFLAVDVCLCSYTTHGHCGILSAEGDHIENSESVDELARLALAYAQAGADCVAPSDMMDGRVAAIRKTLDQAQLHRTILMSYSAKFSSKFYGPFRVAADCAPKSSSACSLSGRESYQIDPGTPRDALASSIRDAEEGADILMVKPGMPYLDVLFQLSTQVQKPWAVYQVSGEYAAIELMAKNGLMDGPAAHLEAWTAFVRAGASMIITYGARFARQYLEKSL